MGGVGACPGLLGNRGAVILLATLPALTSVDKYVFLRGEIRDDLDAAVTCQCLSVSNLTSTQ